MILLRCVSLFSKNFIHLSDSSWHEQHQERGRAELFVADLDKLDRLRSHSQRIDSDSDREIRSCFQRWQRRRRRRRRWARRVKQPTKMWAFIQTRKRQWLRHKIEISLNCCWCWKNPKQNQTDSDENYYFCDKRFYQKSPF